MFQPREYLRREKSDSTTLKGLVAGLRDGIPRRYFIQEENLPTIKGKILFEKMAGKSYTPSYLIPVSHAPLFADNNLSRVLKWTSKKLLRLTHSTKNRELLASCTESLSSVTDIAISSKHISNISLSLLEKQWTRTIEIAQLLLINQSPNPTITGSIDSFSLLMPISHLFERSLRKVLSTSLSGSSLRFTYHTDKHYMLQDCVSGQYSLRLRPDFVFKSHDGKTVGIADGKWKKLSRSSESYGLNAGDLYQISAYLMQYQLDTGILLFPMSDWMYGSTNYTWETWYRIPNSSTTICLLAIDICSLLSTNRRIRENAMESFSRCIKCILEE